MKAKLYKDMCDNVIHMIHEKIEYSEKKLYLKKKETLKELNDVIHEFGSSYKAMIAFINVYKTYPHLFKLKMV